MREEEDPRANSAVRARASRARTAESARARRTGATCGDL